MMATDTQTPLFFSWKGEEDRCGAAWETVSMGLIGANCKSKKENFLTPNFFLFHSRAPPKSSSPDAVKQQIASQSETGEFHASGVMKRSHGVIRLICWLMFVCGCAGPGNGKYCCPKIYFNHRCFSGPYLNKGRIAELPQFIGPGNCVLVLKEVSRGGGGALLAKAYTLVATPWWNTWESHQTSISNGSGPENPVKDFEASKCSTSAERFKDADHCFDLFCVYAWERI